MKLDSLLILLLAFFVSREPTSGFFPGYSTWGYNGMTEVQAKLGPRWGACGLGVLQVCWGLTPPPMGGESGKSQA
jgi:hypothetical protein